MTNFKMDATDDVTNSSKFVNRWFVRKVRRLICVELTIKLCQIASYKCKGLSHTHELKPRNATSWYEL